MPYATAPYPSEAPVLQTVENATPNHLLIIDDDPASIDLFVIFLSDYGFTITVATHGLQGLAMAGRHQPDMILLDLHMPGLDGFEVLAALKAGEATRNIPVLLLSGRNDVDSKVRGFALGAVDYITKPTAEAELQARVTARLHQQRLLLAMERRLRALEQRYGVPDGNPATPDRADLPEQEAKRLYQARQLLQDRLADPPSLDELARLVGTNQPSLSRGFRALFGTTVFGFLREARLRRAHELLTETRTPIKAVALEVGYRNTGDLSRAVKERFGLTPSELRDRGITPPSDR